jgi:hypothetical protein
LKLSGAGEWLVEKHGTSRRRSWRKLHIGVDADTGQIVAAALTTNDIDDGSQVGPLLDQIDRPIAAFTGDGAYDQEGVCGEVAASYPDAMVIVPPHSSAVPSETAETAPTQRDRHLQLIAERSRTGWQKASGGRRGGCCQCPEPHAGDETPELRPHRMRPIAPAITAFTD